VPLSVDSGRVVFTTEPSTAVNGLSYRWAVFRSDRVTHGVLTAVTANRFQVTRLVNDVGDWTGVVKAWFAPDSSTAQSVCLELVRVTRDRFPNATPTYVDSSVAAREDLFPDEQKALSGRLLQPRTIHRASMDSAWVVDAWVIDPTMSSLAVRYLCRVPGREGDLTGTVQLQVLASLVRR
jgi:hypothetical protein